MFQFNYGIIDINRFFFFFTEKLVKIYNLRNNWILSFNTVTF